MSIYKRAFTMMILAAVFALSFSGCISTGIMTDQQANDFFKEMKKVYSDPAVLEREIEVYEDDIDKKDAIGFLKEAMKLFRSDKKPESVDGTFRGHRWLIVNYNTSITYNGKEYFVKSISLSEKKEKGYEIEIETNYEDHGYGSIRYLIKE